VEVVCAWLGELSYEAGWPKIVALAQVAHPVMERLAAHPRLATDPLARSALLDLGFRLTFLADRRGESFLVAKEGEPCPITGEEAEEAFTCGMEWGRLVWSVAPPRALVRMRFAACAKGRAKLRDLSFNQLMGSQSPTLDTLRAAKKQLEEARQIIAEAVQVYPQDEHLETGFRAPIEKLLAEVGQVLSQRGRYGGIS